MATTRRRRTLSGALAGGALLLFPLVGCTGDEPNTGSSVLEDTDAAATSASSAANALGDAVDCSGSSCSVTLGADSQSVEVLGTTLSFDGVQNGEASFSVGGQEVSCTEGQSTNAGPLVLECTTVTEDSVTFTASLA